MKDETQLIERIARLIPSFQRGKRLRRGSVVGIGDDAAVVRPHPGREWVLTVDAFLEGVHFLADRHPTNSVGYKALVRATSDLAAMGAAPRFFLLTLALPKARTGAWFEQLLRGMAQAARSLGLTLIGGDTTTSASVAISVTVIGEVVRGRAVLRSTARPGDVIYVSGRLGQAQLGLELVLRGRAKDKRLRRLLAPHLYPHARIELGAWLASHRVASAMIDLSDGLSSDLGRLCEASRVGARVWAERVSCVEIPAGVRKYLGKRADPLKMALHGGEDYELLFTVPKRLVSKLRRASGFRSLTAIGEIVRGRGVSLVGIDGQTEPLEPLGWDPFRE